MNLAEYYKRQEEDYPWHRSVLQKDGSHVLHPALDDTPPPQDMKHSTENHQGVQVTKHVEPAIVPTTPKSDKKAWAKFKQEVREFKAYTLAQRRERNQHEA